MTDWRVECDDVMKWAENYEGPPFHALLTDCPYELSFMSKKWDATGISFRPETWAALAEHLHPGAFVFAFASTRGWHRMACAMEDAGLVMQPSIFVNGVRLEVPQILGWVTGQSFPKSSRIDTKIDVAAGAERGVVGTQWLTGTAAISPDGGKGHSAKMASVDSRGAVREIELTAPATPLARAWEGHRYGGQILKNCLEPIICCQKPWGERLPDIVATGAGALNVEAARVGTKKDIPASAGGGEFWGFQGGNMAASGANPNTGRWPPNFALVHSQGCVRVGTKRVKGECLRQLHHQSDSGFVDTGEDYYTMTHGDADGRETVDDWLCEEGCAAAGLDAQAGECKSSGIYAGDGKRRKRQGIIQFKQQPEQADRPTSMYSDAGGLSRFYPQHDWSYEIAERLATCAPVRYCAKSSRRERDSGLGEMPLRFLATMGDGIGAREHNPDEPTAWVRNNHPCVKPISLCIWLCNLLTPPPEYAPRRLLVPFCGSGSEMAAAVLSGGFEEVVGIDSDESYCTIARARLRFWHGWRERGYTDPAAVLKRTAKRARVGEAQMRLGL